MIWANHATPSSSSRLACVSRNVKKLVLPQELARRGLHLGLGRKMNQALPPGIPQDTHTDTPSARKQATRWKKPRRKNSGSATMLESMHTQNRGSKKAGAPRGKEDRVLRPVQTAALAKDQLSAQNPWPLIQHSCLTPLDLLLQETARTSPCLRHRQGSLKTYFQRV